MEKYGSLAREFQSYSSSEKIFSALTNNAPHISLLSLSNIHVEF